MIPIQNKFFEALDQLHYSVNNHLKNRLAPPDLMKLGQSLNDPIQTIKQNIQHHPTKNIMLKFQLNLVNILQDQVYQAHQIPDYQNLVPRIKHVLETIENETKEVS